MNLERIQTSLRQIGKTYQKILDGTAQYVLELSIAKLKESKEHYDYVVRNRTRLKIDTEPSWGYTISHDRPLRFKKSQTLGLDLQVDIYCDIQWANEDIPMRQDIKVRIWSEHFDIIYDERRDAEAIFDRLAKQEMPKRVVCRFHFDKAEPNQSGSDYHLQLGGKPEDYELYWHPKKVNVPRLAYQPMDLFLTCQMIAANFFWDEYLEIREKPEWKSELILYQNTLLHNYYQRCFDSINSKESLLDRLWNS